MRIAFLTWRDSTHPDGGGSEVFVEEVARELVRRGHEVTIHCAAHGAAPASEDLDGVGVRRRGGRLTVYPRGLLWLIRNRRRIDVVVDVVNGLPFGSPLIRRRGLVALVHHVHDRQWRIIYPGFRGRLGWFIEGRVTPRIYRRVPFLTVSEASRQDLVALGLPAHQVFVAHNGLRAAPVAAVRSPTPRLCVLARLVPHKQIEQVLDLVRDLRDDLPGLRLDIIGEGWWHEQLVAHARELAVGDLVAFHGHVEAAVRDRLLGEAWLMVLPSVKEGWGLAVLEAAGQGTPSIAYAGAGGIREAIVDGATGRVVDDYGQLLNEVRRLLSDEDAREELGRRAQERSVGFTWSSTADVVEQTLEQAWLSGHRK
jgi:glycosyltransferase involved in cell wall biosynthesis